MLRQLQFNIAKFLNFPLNPLKNSRVQKMITEFEKRGYLKFRVKISKKGWIAECINLDGIMACGVESKPTKTEIDARIKDAIFAAFDIPPYFCDDSLIRNTKDKQPESISNLTYMARLPLCPSQR